MATIGDLVVNLGANTRPLTAGLASARGAVGAFASSLGGLALKGAALGAGMIGISKAFDAAASGIKGAADMEQAEVSFGVLLGSADTAKRVLGDLSTFAAETPFELPELTSAGRSLAAFGFGAEDIVPQLRMVGDLAAGIGQPIGELAEIYGKARVQGRLFGEDINQLTGRGIPIISALAKQFGVAESEVKQMVADGQVGFPQLQKAFESMTGEGGKFEGMMERQSGTLHGLWSTLQDNIGASLRDTAAFLLEAFNVKGLIAGAGAAIESIRSGFASLVPLVQQTISIVSTAWAGFTSFWGEVLASVSAAAGPAFAGIRDFMLDALILGEFAMQNFGGIALLVWEQTKLGAVSTFNDIAHFFTGTLPQLFNWFGSTWKQVFYTAFDLAATVFINLGKNIRSAMSAIWEFIKSGGTKSLAFSWTPLSEGFVNTIKSLPELQEREIGAIEKQLMANVDRMSGQLTEDAGEFMAKRRNDLLGGATSIAAADAESLEKVDVPSIDLADSAKKKIEELKGPAAVTRGSADAFSAIFAAQRGQRDPMDRMAKTADQQLAATNRQTTRLEKALQRIEERTPDLELATI